MAEITVEILPQVYQLRSTIGGRPLYQYLLVGADRAVLVDTGVTNTPREVILPALDQLGVSPQRLQFALITHSDLDHQGGARQIKETLPHVIVGCGDADRYLAEDPEALIRERYDAFRQDHGISYDPEVLNWMRSEGGNKQPMDITWTSGERIHLGDGWVVQILQMPGHSPGHLTVYDPRNGALYMGDAIHHTGYRSVEGPMAMPPTYEQVDAYLGTVRQIEALNLKVLAGAHWPVARGDEIRAFLDETRRYVTIAERGVSSLIQGAPYGVTLREILDDLNQTLGEWPEKAGIDLVYSLAGHVRGLKSRGQITADRSALPVRYRWVR